jgi:hypothetical protein
MDTSKPMELDVPTPLKRSRSRSPADDDDDRVDRKKTATEQTVRAAPIVISTEMMLDKSADRPATPSGGRPRSNATVWMPAATQLLHARKDYNTIVAGP